jgi:glycosyltransferase involved in cell wall biosynthesis/predicted metal-dependent phosphoesterase TrpH
MGPKWPSSSARASTPGPVAGYARCDLHVHSRFSTDTGNYALRRARLAESYTDPERLYRVCRVRGMRFITISDHNTVEGALRIAHLPDTFVSVEVTTRFADDAVPLHALVWNLTEEDHRDLQPYRGSVVELVGFLRDRGLAHALAHPLYRMGPPLTVSHVERLLLLFAVWEGRNGARPEVTNSLACRLATAASRSYLAKLAERHEVEPPAHTRIALSGGSDDHGALDIATTWTFAPGDTPAAFLAAVTAGDAEPGGAHGSALKLAHALGALALNAYRDAGHPLADPVAATFAALFDEDADDAALRHEEIRATSRNLVRVLGSRAREGGLGLDGIGAVGPRLQALAAATALQAPYLGTAHHHAGSCAGVAELESAFFGGTKEEHELDALVFTDTFDEANGVAGTMRRLAAQAVRGELSVRVATARAEAASQPGLTVFAHDWALPLPNYEAIELRFPLVTDVVAFVEERGPRVVHVATPGPVGVCGLVAARLLGLPLVGSYHTELGPYTLHLTHDLLVAQAMDLWVDWFYRQCAVVLAPTHGVADVLRARGHEHVLVWGRGVDTARFAPRRRNDILREHLLGDGTVLLLSVGRLSEEKRVTVLLEAFARLRTDTPGARLAVVGDGPARTSLAVSAPDGVVFLGELRGDALAQVYATADIFCFPSTTDTFGQVILEACASGLPVVAAAAGGAVELVRPGVNGLLVTPDDPAALANALGGLTRDDLQRARLGNGALAAAESRSWARADAELLAGYDAAAGGAPRLERRLIGSSL